MKVRGHHSLPWRCCGVQHPAEQPYCQWCGSSVLSMDRVIISAPLARGDIAIVANAWPDPEEWQFLIDGANASKHAFRPPEAEPEAPASPEAAEVVE